MSLFFIQMKEFSVSEKAKLTLSEKNCLCRVLSILVVMLLHSRVDSTCCGVGSMKPSSIVASTKAIRIHQLVGGSTGPGYGMLCFESQEKILRWLKRPFFIWDKCCHQTLCLHLMESN